MRQSGHVPWIVGARSVPQERHRLGGGNLRQPGSRGGVGPIPGRRSWRRGGVVIHVNVPAQHRPALVPQLTGGHSDTGWS